MDLLGWLWWIVSSLFGLVWGLVWFLLGGWVATLAQVGVIVLVIFGYKYGWRQAPQEALSRLGTVGRFAWGWIRAREVPPRAAPVEPVAREARGHARGRLPQPGDVRINISTMLTLLMFAGLALMATLR